MALIDDLRDDRANAIATYYSSFQSYHVNLEADGDNTYASGEDDQYQAKYKAFNDLIKLHHDALNTISGYIQGEYLDEEEGPIYSSTWWDSTNANNPRAEFYITDKDWAQSLDSMFILNNKDYPQKRNPYILWNQRSSIFGSYDDTGWKNADGISSYNDTRNPLATGSDYRLGEPLEWWGNSDNLIWGSIIFDGRYKYRNNRLNIDSYDTHASQGFVRLVSSTTYPINNLYSPFNSSNLWPSIFNVMRHPEYDDGSNTSEPNAVLEEATSTKFVIDGNVTNNWTVDKTYLMWWPSDIDNKSWTFRVTNITLEEIEETTQSGTTYTYKTHVHYDKANAAITTTESGGGFVGYSVIESPVVPEANKTSQQGDAYDTLWEWIYDSHYEEFRQKTNIITDVVESLVSKLDLIINYDYTVLNDEAGEEIGKQQTATLRDNINSWLANWKSKLNDTGSGTTYSKLGSHWSNSNLDSLISDTSGALKNLIDFPSGYRNERDGLLGNWINNCYTSILGDYSLGSDEQWIPNVNTYSDNNTGSLGSGQQLYVYRFEMVKSRIGREDGVLFAAAGNYKLWNKKVDEIDQLESRMSNIVSDNKYDLTPLDVGATTSEDDKIELEWESTKSAASYTLEVKEGLSGSWQTLEESLGYTHPGWIPDYEGVPDSSIDLEAFTRGHQEFGLSFEDPEEDTGLDDGFLSYDFKLSVDGAQEEVIKVKGIDCQTYDGLSAEIQDVLDELELEAQCDTTDGDIRITSNKKGDGSTVELTAGDNNDLFSALSTSIESPIDGAQVYEPGKVYYFRVRVNNGYNTTFGSGNRYEKDWDSQSEWNLAEYENDMQVHGVPGYVSWDEPGNMLASGFPEDNDLTPSEDHIRIEWEAVVNANQYKVTRSTREDAGYGIVGYTANTYFEDTSAIAGVEYYYKVQAIAEDDYKLYDEDGNLSDNLASDISTTPVRGKRHWVEIVASATTEDRDMIKVTWNELSGATGYYVYMSNMENGTFGYVEKDDGNPKIIRETEFIDLSPAQQFFEKEFDSPDDGLTEFEAGKKYYFILTTDTIKQYYIVSPSSGLWKCEDIANQITNTISSKEDDAICRLVEFNGSNLHYKLKLETKKLGAGANINISNGTFGLSLLSLLEKSPPERGGGAPPTSKIWYQVQGIEEVDGEAVRESERSNKVMGSRPINI